MQFFSSNNQFFFLFIVLSICSGLTIGMNKILITLFGLSLHLENWQLGLINGSETLAMAITTLPAGLLLAVYSPRFIYGLVSILLLFIFLIISHIQVWYFLPVLMVIAGLCIAFRIVAMSSSFLHYLPKIGNQWAGWYKGSLSLGVMALGPFLGQTLANNFSLQWAFTVSAIFFGLMAILGWFTLPHAPQQQTQRESGWLKKLWKNKNLREPCIYETLGSCMGSFFGAFILVIVIREHHWNSSNAVLLLVTYGCTYVSLLLAGGKLLTRYNSTQVYPFSHGLLIIGGLILAFAKDPALFFMGAALNGIGLGLNNLVNISRIANTDANKSHVSGLLTMGQMTGGTSGAILGGILGDLIGLQMVFIILVLPWVTLFFYNYQAKKNYQTKKLAAVIDTKTL